MQHHSYFELQQKHKLTEINESLATFFFVFSIIFLLNVINDQIIGIMWAK